MRALGPARLLRLLLLCLAAAPACAQSQPSAAPVQANPGRPTISTPATLTPVGYLQFETGTLAAVQSGEFDSRESLNEVIKFSLCKRLEALASLEPLVHARVGTSHSTQTSDDFLGAQAVLYPGEGARPTISASYFRHLYAGHAPDLDVGTPENSLLLLASADVHGFHGDLNFFFNELRQAPARRAQFGQSLSVSHNLRRRISLTAELWNFTQPFLRGRAIGNLWAIGVTTRPNLVFDAGFNHGLTSTSTQWQLFAGFTYLLPHRLWPGSHGK